MMNIIKLAAQIFLIYLIYRFIINVVIPIYRSTKQIKKQFGDMQDTMQNMQQGQFRSQTPPPDQTQKPTKVKKEGDYIDFEEVK